MTNIEERTRRALHEVADGLLVSEDDLHHMEEEIMTLVDTPTQKQQTSPSRRWTWAVAAAAAVALVLAGTALWRTGDRAAAPVPASSPTSSTSDAALLFDPAVVGLWRIGPDGEWLWTFTADGRVTWTDTAQGLIHGARELRPVIAQNGDTYDVLQQPGNCVVRLRVTPTGPDSTTIRVVDDQCPGGYDPGAEGKFERVSGRAASSAGLEPHYPAGASGVATSMTQVTGTWVDPETGTVLALDSPASAGGQAAYLVDDDGDGLVAPDQRGRVTMTSSGAVQPVADPSTAGTCAPVFTKVVTDTATMTTTAGPGGCFPAGSTQTWVALN